MKNRRKSKSKVQKVKKGSTTGNEQYKSVVITVPKKLVNPSKLDTLYEIDRLHAKAVNLWLDSWYWRLDMVERILTGRATTQMQSKTIDMVLPSAYVQIAGNRMLDIMREHYLAVQDKLASDIWKTADLTPEYKFAYASMVRNHTLFARFINGDFVAVTDVVSGWAANKSEYLQKAAEMYRKLTHMEQMSIPVRIYYSFLKIRWRWSKPTFKGGSILLDYRVFTVNEAQDTIEFNLWVSVTSARPHNRIKIPFYVTGKKLDVLTELFPGWHDTTKRKGLLVTRGRHIHLSIPVSKEKLSSIEEPVTYIGCDIGMTTPINLDTGSRYGKGFDELVKKNYDEYLRLQAIRNKIRSLRDRVQKRLQIATNPTTVKRLNDKITEYDRHLSDHRWSELRRKIKATIKTEIGRSVNLLIKDLPTNGNVTLILEDLTEMSAEGAKRTRRGRFDISVWSRGELQKHIQEDLEWQLAQVEYVAPEYTSQQCSKCGYVAKENRHGSKFSCKRCGHTENADINAAKNIRERFFDVEISNLAKRYRWNKELRRKKVLELLLQRANQAA